MNNLIVPSKSLGYSNIYLDFLAGADTARVFYPAGSLAEVARRLDSRLFSRDKLCSILNKQNRSFGASQATLENIRKLAEPTAVCFFSGQQAGLFSGPLLVVIKALALAKSARLYSQQLGRPVIPIFWIAGDDHDFNEVNHTFVPDRSSALAEVIYSAAPAVDLPTADIKFADTGQLENARNRLKAALGETDFTAELYRLIDDSYTPDDTFVSAFGKFMTALTRDLGVVYFSPSDPEVKALAQDFFVTLVERQDELHARLNDTNDALVRAGYHLQVEKKESAAHLFYNLDGRKPVISVNDGFMVGENRLSKAELVARIREHPERFSPDVITRPVMQSYLFPTVGQKGGAAEIAYLAQTGRLFDLFDCEVPYYQARPTLTIVEKRFDNIMADYEISFEDLPGDVEQVINRVLAKSFPSDIQAKFDRARQQVTGQLTELGGEVTDIDPSLKDFAQQTFGKIDFALKGLEGKVFASHKKKSQEVRDRIYRLWNALYPRRHFQERTINVTYFLSRYGMNFISHLSERMDSEQTAHQLISPKESTE